jgi:glucose-induced degradation protein 8
LHFALLRLQLIELIRKSLASNNLDLAPALSFATNHLAPRAPTNPDFLLDLEKTMALLIFAPDNLTPDLQELLDPSLRQQIANRVNKAILEQQGQHREARLRNLVRLRSWAEEKAKEAKKDIPSHLSIGLDSEEDIDDDEDEPRSTNGNAVGDAMVQ